MTPGLSVPSPAAVCFAMCSVRRFFEWLARIAWLTVLVVVTFPTLSGQVSVMTTYLPAFKKQRNIHTGDAAASNTVKTRLDVREVLVGKPAVKESPGL